MTSNGTSDKCPPSPGTQSLATSLRVASPDQNDVGRQVRVALRAIAAGLAYGQKVVVQPEERELFDLLRVSALDDRFSQERLNWKLSALVSVNERYGCVKIVGSNAYNRMLNAPRSQSTILLFDKLTMQPIAMYDGTEISAARTGAYASIVIDLLLPHVESLSVFLIGTGAVSEKVLADLEARCPTRIAQVFVKSRTPGRATEFANSLSGRLSFPVRPADGDDMMRDCALVVTASNSREPVFDGESIRADSVVLHLGGDETPSELIQRTLDTGTVLCDDIHAVDQRNSQSLALYFSRKNRSLASEAERFRIRNISQALASPPVPLRGPALVTCVGLPALDLYVAQSLYEQETGQRVLAGATAA